MNSKRYVARSTEIAARRLDDETLIMSGRDSTLFTLNDGATAIWEAADGLTTLDEIVESRICQEFEIGPAEALRDAEEFVEELAGHGIVLLSDKPFSSLPSGREHT
jgi:hypothetical protein